MSDVSVKLVAGFRNHLLIAVHFVDGYLKCVENGITLNHDDLPIPEPDFFAGITDASEIEALRNKLLLTEEDASIQLTDRENVLLYACFILMSYGLITPLGEMLSETILKAMPEDHPFKEFTKFRNNSLKINTQLIENAEEVLQGTSGFATMKEALSTLTLT